MRATAGDRIILAGELVDQPTRTGEVLEARGPDGAPALRRALGGRPTSTPSPDRGRCCGWPRPGPRRSPTPGRWPAGARLRHPAGVVGAGHHLRAG